MTFSGTKFVEDAVFESSEWVLVVVRRGDNFIGVGDMDGIAVVDSYLPTLFW